MNAFEDLSLLRAFVCIVESGGISAAARILKTPQPTLSRHLGILEEQCGAVLLRRSTHRMSLTEAGSRLLGDAKAILALADDAILRLREDRVTLRGHLRLFSTLDSGQFTVTRLVARFLLANPGVTVELGYSNRPLHMIQEGCDAGIITGDITDESVVARPAGRVVRYLCAAPGLIEKLGSARKPGGPQVLAMDFPRWRPVWRIGKGDAHRAKA